MRGQASVEYLILTGFLLLLVGFGFAYAVMSYNDAVRLSQMDQATKRFKFAIEQIHAGGRGNQRMVDVTMPERMTDINVLHICNQTIFSQVSLAGQSGATATDYCRVNYTVDCNSSLAGTQPCGYPPFTLYSALYLGGENNFEAMVYTPAVLDKDEIEDPANVPLQAGAYTFRVHFDPTKPEEIVQIDLKT
jgi:hypothetical protein